MKQLILIAISICYLCFMSCKKEKEVVEIPRCDKPLTIADLAGTYRGKVTSRGDTIPENYPYISIIVRGDTLSVVDSGSKEFDRKEILSWQPTGSEDRLDLNIEYYVLGCWLWEYRIHYQCENRELEIYARDPAYLCGSGGFWKKFIGYK